jgi:hypothetical protein
VKRVSGEVTVRQRPFSTTSRTAFGGHKRLSFDKVRSLQGSCFFCWGLRLICEGGGLGRNRWRVEH